MPHRVFPCSARWRASTYVGCGHLDISCGRARIAGTQLAKPQSHAPVCWHVLTLVYWGGGGGMGREGDTSKADVRGTRHEADRCVEEVAPGAPSAPRLTERELLGPGHT